MRIALFPDDYLPESTLVHAKMFHELALELKGRGHTPIIITPGKPNQSERLVVDVIDGIEIWRFKNGYTRGVGKVNRAINESLISWNAWRAISSKVKRDHFDLCINYSPTIFFGPLVSWIKKTCACPVYLILRDIFPQWVIDEGLIKERSLIARYFRYFERLNYRNATKIGLMSDKNIQYFLEKNPQNYDLEVLRNWADLEPYSADDDSPSLKKDHHWNDKVVFFYGGNIGHSQDTENLLRLARSLKPDPRAHFLFVGQGDEVELLLKKQSEWELDNVTYWPSVSQVEFKKLLTQVDVGLFSLSKHHKTHNFPGKLLGYMVESKPMLGSVNSGNDLIELVNGSNAGIVHVNGEDEKLLQSARNILDSEDYRKILGNNGYQLLCREFSVGAIASQLLSITEGAE